MEADIQYIPESVERRLDVPGELLPEWRVGAGSIWF